MPPSKRHLSHAAPIKWVGRRPSPLAAWVGFASWKRSSGDWIWSQPVARVSVMPCGWALTFWGMLVCVQTQLLPLLGLSLSCAGTITHCLVFISRWQMHGNRLILLFFENSSSDIFFFFLLIITGHFKYMVTFFQFLLTWSFWHLT